MSHIIIVGAGAAGLMAARLLQQKNFTVTVLEARERLGGRIHTLHVGFSRPVEAGAEFIHGKQPITLRLLNEANGDGILLKGKYYRVTNDTVEKGYPIDDHWNTLMSKLNTLEQDVDMATFLHTHFNDPQFADFNDQLRRYVEGYDIADLHRVSAMELRKEWSATDEEHQYRVPDGYERLIRFLALSVETNGGKIIPSTVVNEIVYSGGKASVSTVDGARFDGDKVIVTVPLGVLQKRAITFSPPLTHYQHAIDTMGYGGVIKFLFEFKEPFWEQHRDGHIKNAGFIFSDAPVPTWWTQLPDKTPLLTGWLGGPASIDTDHSADALYAKAVQSLQYIFRCTTGEIERQCDHFTVADWTQDPFSLGGYTYPTVGAHAAKSLLGTPLHGTLFFSGEALYDGQAMGTVEAALVSGIQVVAKVVAS